MLYRPYRNRSNKKGFTLIEVVLVLAIGGLIFLLAFLAFQQTSRNRRDTQRRSDVRKIVAEVENFSVDNTNLYPSFLLTSTYAGTAGTYDEFRTAYLSNFN